MALSDWQSFFQCLLGQRWFRFGIIGLLATVCYFLLGLLFVRLLALPVLLGNALAYILSFIVSYLGQAFWTFQANARHGALLPKYAVAQLIGLGINSLLIEICVKIGLNYEASMVFAIILVPFAVYLLCKYWVFVQKGAYC